MRSKPRGPDVAGSWRVGNARNAGFARARRLLRGLSRLLARNGAHRGEFARGKGAPAGDGALSVSPPPGPPYVAHGPPASGCQLARGHPGPGRDGVNCAGSPTNSDGRASGAAACGDREGVRSDDFELSSGCRSIFGQSGCSPDRAGKSRLAAHAHLSSGNLPNGNTTD